MSYYVEYVLRKRGTKNPAYIYEEYDIIENINAETIDAMRKYWEKRGFEMLYFTTCEDYKDV